MTISRLARFVRAAPFEADYADAADCVVITAR